MNFGPEDHEDEDERGDTSSLEEFEDLVDSQLDDEADEDDSHDDDDAD